MSWRYVNAVAALLLVAGTPPTPGAGAAEVARSAGPSGAGINEAFSAAWRLAAQQRPDGRVEFLYTMPIGDLDGDRRDDLLVHHWDLEPASSGLGYSGTLSVSAVHGRGRRLWRVEREITNGFPIPSIAARIGPRGRNGAVVFTDSTATGYSLTAAGVGSNGTVVWERTFESVYSYEAPFTALRLPIAFDAFDALDGRATDFAVGVLDYVDTVARLDIAVLDGSDGSLVERGPDEVAVGAFPTVTPVGDLDRDGRDDYVVVGHLPGEDGHVRAYSGREGTELWSRAGLALEAPDAWAYAAGDITGDGVAEITVSAPSGDDGDAFHVLDGATGAALWRGGGTFPFRLGDVDGDGTSELGSTSAWRTKTRTGEEHRAYDGDGTLLYRRRPSQDLGSCDDSCWILTFLLDAGDVDSDGVLDLYVERNLFEEDGLHRTRYHFSGRRGRTVLGAVPAVPVLSSLDGRGDDVVSLQRRDGRVNVSAYDGRTGQGLWTTSLRGRPIGATEPYGASAALGGGHGADVFVTLARGDGIAVVALNGRDGTRLWTYRE